MAFKINLNYVKMAVDFTVLLNLTAGVNLVLIGIALIDLSVSAQTIIPVISGLLLLGIGTLLFIGVVKGHAKCTLAYIIISTPCLLAACAYTLYMGVILFRLYHQYESMRFLLPFMQFLAIIISILFSWFVQVCIYLFYKELTVSGKYAFDYTAINTNSAV